MKPRPASRVLSGNVGDISSGVVLGSLLAGLATYYCTGVRGSACFSPCDILREPSQQQSLTSCNKSAVFQMSGTAIDTPVPMDDDLEDEKEGGTEYGPIRRGGRTECSVNSHFASQPCVSTL